MCTILPKKKFTFTTNDWRYRLFLLFMILFVMMSSSSSYGEEAQPKREELLKLANNNILLAFTAYTSACLHNKISIREQISKDKEAAGMYLEVFMGFLHPALSSRLFSSLQEIAKNIPNQTSAMASLISNKFQNPEFVKNLIRQANTGILYEVKSNLYGNTGADNFLISLEVERHRLTAELLNDLKNKSDEQLVGLATIYDWRVANVDVYMQHVQYIMNLWKYEVWPIYFTPTWCYPYEILNKPRCSGLYWKEEPTTVRISYLYKAVIPQWVKYRDGRKRLAIVEYTPYKMRYFAYLNKIVWLNWISAEMQPYAIRKIPAGDREGEIELTECDSSYACKGFPSSPD